MSREPGRFALFGSGVALAVLLFIGLVLIELFVDIPSRRIAMQVATAVVLALAVLKIRTLVHRSLSHHARSEFDAAAVPAPPVPPDRTRFHQLYDEVRFGARSQRYFDLVFWPRLVDLARPAPGEPPLAKPAGRSFGRGPSVEALADVVAAIEARR